jgi:kynureninase
MSVRVTRTAKASWQGDLAEGGGRIGVGSGAYEGPFTLRARVEDVERSTNPEELIGAAHAGCFTMSLANLLTESGHPPADLQTSAKVRLEGVAQARGLQLMWLDGDPETVGAMVGPDTALVTFSHVSYRSARIADMAQVNAVVGDAGALMLWDLSHSAGSVPLSLDGDHAPLAVGCTYKYLNGGPGAPAYMYVRHELQAELRQPIWG